MSWVYVALAMALLFFGIRKLGGIKEYEENFPAGAVPAIGTALTAGALCIAVIAEMNGVTGAIESAACVFGFIAVAALLLLAWCRFIGSRPNMLLHTSVCVFLMIYLVSHYRLWSAYPQLQSYAFELMAIVFTMLACYQRAAFDVGMGNRRMYTFFTLAALFFSVSALPGSDNPVFFLGCAVWMFFTPCCLDVGEDTTPEAPEAEQQADPE